MLSKAVFLAALAGIVLLAGNSASVSSFSGFAGDLDLEEAGSPEESNSRDWWLDSGGMFYLADGIGRTIQGDLARSSRWRVTYGEDSPRDTDGGYHPQNIFRLIARREGENFSQEAYFKINKYNLSASESRNESNGLLFMARYADDDNLYYAGVRVDGALVVKKKLHGKYSTLGYKTITGAGAYDRERAPNALPVGSWIGLRMQVVSDKNDSAVIKVSADLTGTGVWQEELVVTDTKSVIKRGSAGIRSDFMDLEVKDYSLRPL